MVSLKSLSALSALLCILSFVNHVCHGIPPSSFFSENWTAEDEARAQVKGQGRISSVSEGSSISDSLSKISSFSSSHPLKESFASQPITSFLEGSFASQPITSFLGRNPETAEQKISKISPFSSSHPSKESFASQPITSFLKGSFASQPITSFLGRNPETAEQKISTDEQAEKLQTKSSGSHKMSMLMDINPEESSSPEAFSEGICSTCHLVRGGSSAKDGAKASSPSSEGSFSSQPIAALLAQNSGPAKAEPTLLGRKPFSSKLNSGTAEPSAQNAEISNQDAKISSNIESKNKKSLKISTLLDMNPQESSSPEASKPTYQGCISCHFSLGGSSSVSQISEESSDSQPTFLEESSNPQPTLSSSPAEDLDANILVENSGPAKAEPTLLGRKPFSSKLNSGTAEPSAQNAEISNQDAKISSNIESKNKESLKISTLLDMNPQESSSPEASKPTYQGCSSCHLALGGSSSVSQISEESSDSQSSFSEESSDSLPTFLEESSNPQPTLSSSPAEDLDANILVENDPFLAEILAASPAGSKPNERGCQTCHLVHGG